MADQIPGAELVRSRGAGHLSNLEAPEAFDELLAALLTGAARRLTGRSRAARRLTRVTTPEAFAAQFPFALDDVPARRRSTPSTRGHSVLVAAPTGSGKTVVAEFAIERSLAIGAARPSTRRR